MSPIAAGSRSYVMVETMITADFPEATILMLHARYRTPVEPMRLFLFQIFTIVVILIGLG